MDTMERDPIYIAAQVKFIRKAHRLTQENLAEAAGVSTRTIEKIESGRHCPDEQTLRSIARAVQVNVSFFEKPDPEQEERQREAMLRAQRKTVFAPIKPVRTVNDILSAFGQLHAWRIDTSMITDEAALDAAAGLSDWIRDCGEIWEDCYMSQRVEYARDIVRLCEELDDLGYVCFIGSHRQQRRQKDRARLVFTVGILTVLPKETSGETSVAMIQLDDAWESLEEDREPLF